MKELPEKLIVPCCPGKLCGNTEVYLDGTLDKGVLKYIYRRCSNGDDYTKPMTHQEMIGWIDNKPELN